jgi:hypothetical protein
VGLPQENSGDNPDETANGPVVSKEMKLAMLDEMIHSFEKVLPFCGTAPINHYDHYNALLLLSAILRDCAA